VIPVLLALFVSPGGPKNLVGVLTGGDDFDDNRWNDLHYSLSAKQAARDAREAAE